MTEAEAFNFTAAAHEGGHCVCGAALGLTGIVATIDPPLTRYQTTNSEAPLLLVVLTAGDVAVDLIIPREVHLLAGGPQPVNRWESDDAQQWNLMRKMKWSNPRELVERAADTARTILGLNLDVLTTIQRALLAGETITDAQLALKVRQWEPSQPQPQVQR